MKLEWDKNTMKEAREKLLEKEKLTISDSLAIKFYNCNLDNKAKVIKISNKKLTDEEIIEELEKKRQEFYSFTRDQIFNYKPYLNMLEELKYLALNYCINDDLKTNNSLVSNQDLFDTSYDVFGSISNYLERSLDYIYNQGLVKVVRKNSNKNSYCHLDIGNKLGFASIYKQSYLALESVYNHELAHSITCINNPKFYFQNGYYFQEFSSTFMQYYTDNFLFNKTNNKKYLYSNYNAFDAYNYYIGKLSIMNELTKIKGRLTRKKIEDKIENTYGEVSKDFNESWNSFLEEYSLKDFYYLIGICCTLNLFLMDPCDMKKKFNDTFFNDIKTVGDFYKTISYPYLDPYFTTDIFNEASSLAKKQVRKLK